MILCIGEILADLIGEQKEGLTIYKKFPGGAPFNVACGLANYNAGVKFIGNVGNDLIGHFLVKYAGDIENLDSCISIDNTHNTTLAFVENGIDGERSFSFFRKNTADYHLNKIDENIFKDVDIVHLGSLMLSKEAGRESADYILKITKKLGKKLSFDINFRKDIFENKNEAIKIYSKYALAADIIKFSLEELELFTGLKDIKKALSKIAIKDKIILLTLGGDGSIFYLNGKFIKESSINVKPVDTTGAGDAFLAGALYKLSSIGFDNLNDDNIRSILRFANVCGAIATTSKGAISSLPKLTDVLKLI